MQKDLEEAKSLVQTSSKQNQERLNQTKSLLGKESMLRAKVAESGKMSQSIEDSTTSEPEAIQELMMKIISLRGSLSDKGKSLDEATLSLDRSESLVMRLVQQIRDLQEIGNV